MPGKFSNCNSEPHATFKPDLRSPQSTSVINSGGSHSQSQQKQNMLSLFNKLTRLVTRQTLLLANWNVFTLRFFCFLKNATDVKKTNDHKRSLWGTAFIKCLPSSSL